MGFFKEWPIWQKLVFVSPLGCALFVDEECGNADLSTWQILGCAIVVTVILGCAKLGYTHWKSSTLPEKERIEQAMQRQMSQRRRAGSDVPFGIRAIESGIEIEGVWISRPNTPDGTRETSVASSKWDYGPRKDFIIDIESQEIAPNHGGAGSGSDRPSSNRTSRASSPDINISKPPKSKHPPLAYSKYTGNPALQQGSVAGTLEGLDAIYRASGPMDAMGVFEVNAAEESFGSSESSNKSGTDSESISASAPRLLNSQRTRQQSADLDLRRMSQAAETGQLTPRVRREHGDYFCPPREQSPPPVLNGDQCSPPSTSPSARSPNSNIWASQIDRLPPAVRKTSLPDVTPFTKFCLTAPASPLTRPASPVSSISSINSDSSSRPSAGEPKKLPPAQTLAVTPPLTQIAPPPRSSFDTHDSMVLRGHGTGFEILQPGTLFPSHTTDRKQRNAPPVSLLNGALPRSDSTDHPRRKLIKKRRPSADSDTSSREGGSSIARGL